MRIWSFQSQLVAEAMRTQSRYHSQWEHVYDRWWPAYKWMVRAMEERGISTDGHPPIWAWQSCSPQGGPPTLDTARALLSDGDLEKGIIALELEVLESLLVLSSYSRWNEALDHTIDHGTEPPDSFQNMFLISHRSPDDDIQACFSFVESSWILRARPLDLRPDDEDYDQAKLA